MLSYIKNDKERTIYQDQLIAVERILEKQNNEVLREVKICGEIFRKVVKLRDFLANELAKYDKIRNMAE